MNAADLRDDYPFGVTMKAVIIYDHSEFVANETLLLGLMSPPVKGAADGIAKRKVMTYELETLKQATAAETVLTEAAEADLVVLALNKTELVPPWLMNWVARWAACSRADAAFLLVGGGFDAKLSPLTDLELQLFVKSHASECSYEDGSLAEGSHSTSRPHGPGIGSSMNDTDYRTPIPSSSDEAPPAAKQLQPTNAFRRKGTARAQDP